jgi:cyanophycinase
MKISVLIFSIFVAQLSLAAQIFRTGNPADQVSNSRFYACLAGGGDDDGWGAGWKELLNSTDHGDVVIIRADDSRGGYEDWIYNDTSRLDFPKVNSVSTIILESKKDGNSQSVLKILQDAEMIFFAGGDQSLYIDYLKNTKAAQLIQSRLDHFELSIAGTSAGMAILGEFDYGAHYSSPADEDSNVTAKDVLQNPMGNFVDIDQNFIQLPYLNKTITDTHFSQRVREGRLLGFMAKIMLTGNVLINGIGSDEETAICLDRHGRGKVFGNGNTYIIKPDIFPVINNDASLNFPPIKVFKLKKNDYFDFNLWNSSDAQIEYWKVENKNSIPTLVKF